MRYNLNVFIYFTFCLLNLYFLRSCAEQRFILSISCSDWPRAQLAIRLVTRKFCRFAFFFYICFLFSPICELTSPRAPNSEPGSVIGRWTSVLFSDWLAPQAHTLFMCPPCEAKHLFFCLPPRTRCSISALLRQHIIVMILCFNLNYLN